MIPAVAAGRGADMRRSARALSIAIAGLLALDCISAGRSLAECVVAEPLRPVHRTYIRRDVVEPGVYAVGRSPSVYGWTQEPVESATVAWHEEPAVFRTVPVRIKRAGGW